MEERRPQLVNELTQGRELANQLKEHLHKTTISSPQQACEDFLLQKILSSYEKALSMVNPKAADDTADSSYSYSYSYSPHQHHPHHSTNNNKRKTMEKWSEQVKVCSGSTVEGPLSDGYSWRKYGQKDILGATHPRAYYRCTHRNVQGCLATKQVQRSDEDSSVFEVTYRGRHTCIQATQLSKALEKKPRKEQEEKEEKMCRVLNNNDCDGGFSFKAGGDENEKSGCLFPSFSFASTPIETENLEDLFYLGTTFNHILQASDSDLSEDIMNSTPPNSVTNSPLGDLDWDFSLDLVDFDATDSI